ncbi:MAG: protein-S-isoprenylcysteine O-methyltransferase [Salaquimonas sp.]
MTDENGLDWIFIGKVIWVIGVVGWGIIRFKPNIKSRKTKIATTKRPFIERFSMFASQLGLGIVPAIWVFGGFPSQFNHPVGPVSILIGAAIFAYSLVLFKKTHKALGKMWSHSLDLREGHKLVTQGIYEKVRHPMYTAFWLWAVAPPFLLGNWIAGFAGIAGFGTLYFLRVGREEAMMEAEFGQEYRDYKARTKKIIPGIY